MLPKELEALRVRVEKGELKEPEKIGAAAAKILQRYHGHRYFAWELRKGQFHYFSHPVNFPIPQGIKVEIPGDSKGTIVILTGSDKEKMGQTAAKIRAFRPPEPYGGKGVRYQGEKVREKAGKAGKGGK